MKLTEHPLDTISYQTSPRQTNLRPGRLPTPSLTPNKVPLTVECTTKHCVRRSAMQHRWLEPGKTRSLPTLTITAAVKAAVEVPKDDRWASQSCRGDAPKVPRRCKVDVTPSRPLHTSPPTDVEAMIREAMELMENLSMSDHDEGKENAKSERPDGSPEMLASKKVQSDPSLCYLDRPLQPELTHR